ncbi:MAG: GntR family transcriptional regulator [Anaerolineae bacterium]
MIETPTLDARSDVPLYHQLHQILKQQIESGLLKPEEKLKSEREFSATYGICRATVQKAIKLLRQEGLVYTRPGSGIYVASRRKPGKPRLMSPFEEMQEYGFPCSLEILRAETIKVKDWLSSRLALREGERVHVLQRLCRVGGLSLGIVESYVPYTYAPQLLDYDFVEISLYEVLEQTFDVRLTWAEQTFGARLAIQEECELLDLDPDLPTALLTLERITYDAHEKRVEYMTAVYRGERYRFPFSLMRS